MHHEYLGLRVFTFSLLDLWYKTRKPDDTFQVRAQRCKERIRSHLVSFVIVSSVFVRYLLSIHHLCFVRDFHHGGINSVINDMKKKKRKKKRMVCGRQKSNRWMGKKDKSGRKGKTSDTVSRKHTRLYSRCHVRCQCTPGARENSSAGFLAFFLFRHQNGRTQHAFRQRLSSPAAKRTSPRHGNPTTLS